MRLALLQFSWRLRSFPWAIRLFCFGGPLIYLVICESYPYTSIRPRGHSSGSISAGQDTWEDLCKLLLGSWVAPDVASGVVLWVVLSAAPEEREPPSREKFLDSVFPSRNGTECEANISYGPSCKLWTMAMLLG